MQIIQIFIILMLFYCSGLVLSQLDNEQVPCELIKGMHMQVYKSVQKEGYCK